MNSSPKNNSIMNLLPEFASLVMKGNAGLMQRYLSQCEAMNRAGFSFNDNQIIFTKTSSRGNTSIPVCNFVAFIVKDYSLMKGEKTSSHALEIGGWSLKTKQDLPQITIKATDLAKGDWVAEQWGSDAQIISGGKTYLSDMIHAMSQDIKKIFVYHRTGWLNRNNSRNFLHARGSLFADNIEVDLCQTTMSPVLQKFHLPDKPDALATVAPTVLSLLNVSKEHLSYPLLAAALLAPLGECMRENGTPIDFTLFLVGRSESGKSSLAALHQSFFGEFDKQGFPANFTDTDNSLEPKIEALQDVLMVVDDDFPDNNERKNRMHAVLQKIVRAISDGNTRSRMGGKTFIPRTFPLCTGEYIPKLSPSTLNRILFLKVEQSDLDYAGAFKQAWQNREHLRHFMVHYLRWIAENWDLVKKLLIKNITLAENQLTDHNSGRARDAASKLPAGLAVGLKFLLESKIISEDQYVDHMHRAGTVITAASTSVINQNKAPEIAETFLEAVSSLIQTASYAIIPLNEETCPKNWIGCYDESHAYLLPTEVFAAVKKHCQQQGILFQVTSKEVWTDLEAHGIVCYDNNRKRFSRQKKLPCRNNKNIDVLVIARDKIEGL